MINWNNMDTLPAYAALKAVQPIDLRASMSGENGAHGWQHGLQLRCPSCG